MKCHCFPPQRLPSMELPDASSPLPASNSCRVVKNSIKLALNRHKWASAVSLALLGLLKTVGVIWLYLSCIYCSSWPVCFDVVQHHTSQAPSVWGHPHHWCTSNQWRKRHVHSCHWLKWVSYFFNKSENWSHQDSHYVKINFRKKSYSVSASNVT